MLQNLDPTQIDLTKFYSSGEGFASWHFKASLWLGDEHQLVLPAIEIKQSSSGDPVLKDDNVVSFIASKVRLGADLTGSMIYADLEALKPIMSGLFADEFNPPDTINLKDKPRQFCQTCFTDALLRKSIPIFNPHWQCAWATHCIDHNTPLAPVELLDSHDYQNYGFWYDDGSQYRNWCNRLEGAKKEIIRKNISTPDIRVGAASKTVIAVNRLFHNAKEARRGVMDLGLEGTPEYVRQKFYTAFYLLSRRYRQWFIGRDLTHTNNRHGCFPTTEFFSYRITDLMKPEQVNQCIEYLAQFISDPAVNFPYLISPQMKDARIEFSKRIESDCPELQNDPMLYLSWLAWDHFNESYSEKVSDMFPLYAKDWKACYADIESYSSQQYG